MEQGLGHRSAYRGQQLGVVVSGHHSRKEQVLLWPTCSSFWPFLQTVSWHRQDGDEASGGAVSFPRAPAGTGRPEFLEESWPHQPSPSFLKRWWWGTERWEKRSWDPAWGGRAMPVACWAPWLSLASLHKPAPRILGWVSSILPIGFRFLWRGLSLQHSQSFHI